MIFIPEGETCFYIYRADSIEAVRAAAARSSLQFERVSEAVTEVGMPVPSDTRYQMTARFLINIMLCTFVFVGVRVKEEQCR